jgi:phosphatidylglycerophosphatase C
MQQIAVFDFDKTLFKKDSFLSIYKFIVIKYPIRFIFLPIQVLSGALYWLKILDAKTFKSYFLFYLYNMKLEILAANLEEFWSQNQQFNQELLSCIQTLNNSGITTVVVSASPTLFLKKACKDLGIKHVIGTELTYQNGNYKIAGKNCRGREKISRLLSFFEDDIEIIWAFSDNKDDQDLLNMSKNSFWIKNGKLINYEPIK